MNESERDPVKASPGGCSCWVYDAGDSRHPQFVIYDRWRQCARRTVYIHRKSVSVDTRSKVTYINVLHSAYFDAFEGTQLNIIALERRKKTL